MIQWKVPGHMVVLFQDVSRSNVFASTSPLRCASAPREHTFLEIPPDPSSTLRPLAFRAKKSSPDMFRLWRLWHPIAKIASIASFVDHSNAKFDTKVTDQLLQLLWMQLTQLELTRDRSNVQGLATTPICLEFIALHIHGQNLSTITALTKKQTRSKGE